MILGRIAYIRLLAQVVSVGNVNYTDEAMNTLEADGGQLDHFVGRTTASRVLSQRRQGAAPCQPLHDAARLQTDDLMESIGEVHLDGEGAHDGNDDKQAEPGNLAEVASCGGEGMPVSDAGTTPSSTATTTEQQQQVHDAASEGRASTCIVDGDLEGKIQGTAGQSEDCLGSSATNHSRGTSNSAMSQQHHNAASTLGQPASCYSAQELGECNHSSATHRVGDDWEHVHPSVPLNMNPPGYAGAVAEGMEKATEGTMPQGSEFTDLALSTSLQVKTMANSLQFSPRSLTPRRLQQLRASTAQPARKC